MNNNNSTLLQSLNNCIEQCNNCAVSCLDEDNVKMLAACIKLDLDCADICRLAVILLARNSEHAQHLLKECAEICTLCAEECEKHASMHEHCRSCAEACRDCAEACTLAYK